MAYFLKKTKSSPSRGYGLKIYFSYRDPETKKPTNRQHKNCGYVNDLIAAGDPDPIATVMKEIDELNARWNEQKKEKKEKQIGEISPEVHFGYFPLKRMVQKLNVQSDLDWFQRSSLLSFPVFETLMSVVYVVSCHRISSLKDCAKYMPTLFDKPEADERQIVQCLRFVGENYEKYMEAFVYHVQETYGLDASSFLLVQADLGNPFGFAGMTACGDINEYGDIDECGNIDEENEDDDEYSQSGKKLCQAALLFDSAAVPAGMMLFRQKTDEVAAASQIQAQTRIAGPVVFVWDKTLNAADKTLRQKQRSVEMAQSFLANISRLDRNGKLDDEDVRQGYILACWISMLLRQLFQSRVLQDRFDGRQVEDYIQQAKVVQTDTYHFINLCEKTPLIEWMVKTFDAPLMHFHLKQSDIDKIFDRII